MYLKVPVCYEKISNCQDKNTICCMFFFPLHIYCQNVVNILSICCQKYTQSIVSLKSKGLKVKREYIISDLPLKYV